MALLPFQRRIAIHWRDFQDPTSSAGTAQTHFPLDAAAAQRPFQPVEAPPRLEHRGGYPPRRGRFAIFTRYSWRSSKSHMARNIEFYQGTYINSVSFVPRSTEFAQKLAGDILTKEATLRDPYHVKPVCNTYCTRVPYSTSTPVYCTPVAVKRSRMRMKNAPLHQPCRSVLPFL